MHTVCMLMRSENRMDTEEADKNALQKAQWQIWDTMANRLMARGGTPDPTALDLPSLFVYRDEKRRLVFMWDGETQHHVEVTLLDEDDYPVIWRWYFLDHKHPRMVAVGYRSAVLTFQQVCGIWADAMERHAMGAI